MHRSITRAGAIMAIVVSMALVAAACTGAASDDAAPVGPLPPDVVVRGSVEQIGVEGTPGATVTVRTADGDIVDTGELDAVGGLLWRDVQVGDYDVTVDDGAVAGTTRVTVTDPSATPDQSLYADQTLVEGFNYLTTRDGTPLGAMVTLPSGATLDDGPFPTLVEYSGYDLSNPFEPTAGSSPFRLVSPFLDYAVVQVQMRGTGCSAGAFDYFEPLQTLDGYDLVETVAAQDWVLNNKVGMVGISYPGISQLFVAQTQPPSLAAITPLSVIADTARSVLYPGGILNNGFALDFAQGRMAGARPAPDGQSWVQRKIDGDAEAGFAPDEQCAANQRLHGQAMDLVEQIDSAVYDTPDYAYLSPQRLVGDIEVPTLMVGTWQDEQTGGQWPYLIDAFPADTYVRAIGQNGAHIDPLGPENIGALFEFLDFFVAERVPTVPGIVRGLAATLYSEILGSAPPAGATADIPEDRFTGEDFATAKAAYLAEDRIIIRFDNGAGPNGTQGGFFGGGETMTFPSWPVVTDPTEWFLTPDRTLSTAATDGDDDPVGYTYNGSWGERTLWSNGDGCSEWQPEPVGNDGASCYVWEQAPAGERATFTSPVLDDDVVMVGGGVVNLWLASDATDTDVEVLLTEVRPDGQEVYVQSGWLRASHRALDEELSQPLMPWPTHLEADAQPLVPGEFTPMEVGIFPFGQIFRAGSKIRLTIASPGGNRILWKFDSLPGTAANTVGTSTAHPSSVLLPVVSGTSASTPLPPCVQRAQPCRLAED